MTANQHTTPQRHEKPASAQLKNVFEANLNLGVSFRDCFMLVLKQSGYTQAGFMRRIGRKQPELSQYLNGHRQPNVPADLRHSCEALFGFDPWNDVDNAKG